MTRTVLQMILTHPDAVPIIGAAMTAMPIGSVEIEDLVARRAQLDFRFPAASLPRLASLAAAVDEPAKVPLDELHARLAFQPGAEGYPQLHLIVGGSVVLACQRCLKALDWPVDVDVRLTMVRTDREAEALADPVRYAATGERWPGAGRGCRGRGAGCTAAGTTARGRTALCGSRRVGCQGIEYQRGDGGRRANPSSAGRTGGFAWT